VWKLLWSNRYGVPSIDAINKITIDSSGNIVFIGYMPSVVTADIMLGRLDGVSGQLLSAAAFSGLDKSTFVGNDVIMITSDEAFVIGTRSSTMGVDAIAMVVVDFRGGVQWANALTGNAVSLAFYFDAAVIICYYWLRII
jgi:hypothetical protein